MRTVVLQYAHLHLPQKWRSFVGKYSSNMEHLGMGQNTFFNVFTWKVWVDTW
jgi:hypothetical protein